MKRNNNVHTKTYLTLPRGTIHNGEKWKTHWLFIQCIPASQYRMNKLLAHAKISKHSVKQKKPEPREHMLYDPFI